MQQVGYVSGLWRYPASSLGGEPMGILDIDLSGAKGDRLFGLVEVATDEIARPDGDRKWHKVPRIKARFSPDGVLEIATPKSGWLPSPSAESDEAISIYLGFAASIRSFDRKYTSDAYTGPLTAERYRKAPVHLLTTASMARLKALHPQGDPDPRRFRPNIVVDMPQVEGSFPETEWIGRRLAIGEMELTISEPCRRCGFAIIAQDGFDNDPNILRNLVHHNAHNMGVYCTVDRPARIPLGAPMRFL